MSSAIKNPIDLDTIDLKAGGHQSFERGSCLLEAVSYIAGEPWSDHPSCVSEVLGAYGRRLNDGLPDDERQKLKPFIPRLIGTAGDGQDEARRWLAADWSLRTATPRFLDAAGLTEFAEQLRALDPIVDEDSVRPARTIAYAARSAARELRRSSREALAGRIKAEMVKGGAAAADVAALSKEDRYWKVRQAVYSAVRAHFRENPNAFGEKFAELERVTNAEGIELLGRMIDPSAAK